MMAKEPKFKWKIKFAPGLAEKMRKLPEKDRKILAKGIAKFASSPVLPATPYEPVEIPAMPWEKCECGQLETILYDKNSDEVQCFCSDENCVQNSFGHWFTKKEFEEGRVKYEAQEKLCDCGKKGEEKHGRRCAVYGNKPR